jgi:hypothetical protein
MMAFNGPSLKREDGVGRCYASLVKAPLRRTDQRFGDVPKAFALHLAKAGEELT